MIAFLGFSLFMVFLLGSAIAILRRRTRRAAEDALDHVWRKRLDRMEARWRQNHEREARLGPSREGQIREGQG